MDSVPMIFRIMESLLETPVLVLNRYWQPVHTCSVRRSIRLLCTGHAQAVQVEGEEVYRAHDLQSWIRYSAEFPGGARLHSTQISLRVPSVLVLAFYTRVPRMEVRFSRRNVFLRDAHTCQYCGKKLPEEELNLDHVMPRDKGGITSWENIVTSCFRCNTRKANKLPDEAGMRPKSRPVAPRWHPLFGLGASGCSDESWQRFLGPVGGTSRLSA